MWCITSLTENVDYIRIFKTKEDLMHYMHLYEDFVNNECEPGDLAIRVEDEKYNMFEDPDIYIWEMNIEENGSTAFNDEKIQLLKTIEYNKIVCELCEKNFNIEDFVERLTVKA